MMFTREANPGLGRSGRVTPALEGLEDRCCPSTIALQGTIFRILGDNTSNTITVRDAGNGVVTATVRDANGHQVTRTARDVSEIQIITGNGNDKVDYALTGKLTRSEGIAVTMGNGTDTASLNFAKGAGAVGLNVQVKGGTGNEVVNAVFGELAGTQLKFTGSPGTGLSDLMKVQFQGALTGAAHANVAMQAGSGYHGMDVLANAEIGALASLNVNILGGPQGDTSHVDYTGKLLGHLTVNANGGAGADFLESTVNLAAGSTGSLVDHLYGGAGDDLLIMHIQGAYSHLRQRDAVANGGGGQNVGLISGPVKVIDVAERAARLTLHGSTALHYPAVWRPLRPPLAHTGDRRA
jgi:hypothetical protein